MDDLFTKPIDAFSRSSQPLAERMRPQKLSDFLGQDHLLADGKILRRAIETDNLMSLILWGPPGVGKTTLARIIALETKSEFHHISAVTSGVKDLRQIIDKAKYTLTKLNKKTILFIDEIHRFNKAQQDALLQSVEEGTITLIGATTENPSFEVISALLSRCKVYRLEPLRFDELRKIINRALETDPLLKSKHVSMQEQAIDALITYSGGDARIALNVLEITVNTLSESPHDKLDIDIEAIQQTFQTKLAIYDKSGDYHYDVISAFIKSVRGSDPDAAIYWLARMLHGGEDPKFIARRLIILASEDIGNAHPHALTLATAAFTAVDYVGMPEAQLILAQVTTYLASVPKSNASYLAIRDAMKEVTDHAPEPVPLHLRNAPTKLLEDFDYAKDYRYPHDFPGNFVEQSYLPDSLANKIFYRPGINGFEKTIDERLKELWKKRQKE